MPENFAASARALDIASLAADYRAGVDPESVIDALHRRIRADETTKVWISVVPAEMLAARIAVIKDRRARGEALPLFGVPFAVKDNIDVAGMATTAGCPAFAYRPAGSATVVEKLEQAGAILLGKTNLDQFATGLVGTRSPYGIPGCAFDDRYIAGGSSSGSALAVAQGLVSFALGTDTAGSGRVPASFNNIVGLKPTRGWLSTAGVFPACRTLDCVSVFAGTVEDAFEIAKHASGFDEADPYSRRAPARRIAAEESARSFRFGIPAAPLDFCGDRAAQALFEAAVSRLQSLGGVAVEIDLAPFSETGALLYGGPWVAERLAAIGSFAETHADDLLPITREIILAARKLSAVDVFRGQYRLAALAQRAAKEWRRMDVLLLPTAPTIYRIADVLDDPLRLNGNLGLYTSFANLLDLSAIAVPAGLRDDGLPFGVSLIGRAFQDTLLADIAGRMHRALDGATVGATARPLPSLRVAPRESKSTDTVQVAMLGAHLSGQPLNAELTDRGAFLLRTAHTSRGYSLYALSEGPSGRPGLVFDGIGDGRIELEIWSMPANAFGSFVAAIPPPLGIGTIALDDETLVKGFICESHAIAEAENITRFGGWRAYLKR